MKSSMSFVIIFLLFLVNDRLGSIKNSYVNGNFKIYRFPVTLHFISASALTAVASRGKISDRLFESRPL